MFRQTAVQLGRETRRSLVVQSLAGQVLVIDIDQRSLGVRACRDRE